jgi:hypothetical protein
MNCKYDTYMKFRSSEMTFFLSWDSKHSMEGVAAIGLVAALVAFVVVVVAIIIIIIIAIR